MDIRESLHAVLQQKEILAEGFYDRFFERCPEARQHFAGVNLRRQAVLLTMALMVLERNYTCPCLAAEEYLKYLGTKHHDRLIPRELYPGFQDALLATLESFHGPDWEQALAGQWREAISRATAMMFDGYRQHYTV